MVERRPEKAGVASSILAPGTIRSQLRILAKEIYFAVGKTAPLSRSVTAPSMQHYLMRALAPR